MAFCVIKLTNRDRQFLAVGLSVLVSIAIIIGFSLIVIGILVMNTSGTKIFSEGIEIKFTFTVISIFGFNLIIQYLFGIPMIEKCHRQAYKKSTSRLLFYWILSAYNFVFYGLILSWLAPQVQQHIIRSLRFALQRGMTLYSEEKTWRQMIDNIQQNSQCCGIDGYKDWHSISWFSIEYINNIDAIQNLTKTTGHHIALPVTPWSCCRLDFDLPCFHDPIQQNQAPNIWDSSVPTDSVYSDGCLNAMQYPIEIAFLYLIIISVCLLILQFFITVGFRILFTSSKNDVLLKNPNGEAPGWIFEFGSFHEDYIKDILRKGSTRRRLTKTDAQTKQSTDTEKCNIFQHIYKRKKVNNNKKDLLMVENSDPDENSNLMSDD